MAASYSSFLTTQYYSPVFNTALFDGPFRIYFSQSYESVALKIYHLLQTQDLSLWTEYKKWSEKTKKHAFILIYPSDQDLAIAFDGEPRAELMNRLWDEGLILGFANSYSDESFGGIYQHILTQLKTFIGAEKTNLNLQF
ncbi:hypothetical protein CIK05_04875 [Bdellovibrio sp. qaytius]|nr:hypothetical protein CIK05_04875 [Bdellovibrio sp. qaytius]